MNVIVGTPNADSLVGTNQDDSISGGAGNDELSGLEGRDTLIGGDGDDTLWGYYSDKTLLAGEGNDRVLGSFFGNTHIELGSGNDFLDVGFFFAGCSADAGDGDDSIIGQMGGATIVGGAGNDYFLVESWGSIDGGDGNDTIYADTAAMITGGAGRDQIFLDWSLAIQAPQGGAAIVTDFEAGPGGDQLDLSYVLTDSNPFTEGYLRFEQKDDAAVLQAFVSGPGGGSWVDALRLEHVVVAQLGRDNFAGPLSIDGIFTPVNASGGAGADSLFGYDGNDSIRGMDGDDSLYGGYGGNDTLLGGRGRDMLQGMNGNDLLRGGAGDDSLFGDSGRDTLLGDSGNDYLKAFRRDGATEADADVLYGGAGRDTLAGGFGGDTYHFGHGSDVDIIQESFDDVSPAAIDTVQFKAGVDYDELWATQDDYNLNIRILGTNDVLCIENWYASSESAIEKFRLSNGLTLPGTQVEALVAAMATMEPPASDATHLSGSVLRDLEAVLTHSH